MTKIVLIVSSLVMAIQGIPIWINGYTPSLFIHQTPSIGYAFGSGFSSDIGGVKHSSGIGAAFQSGGGQAYATGIGSSGPNGAHAIGTGSTNAGYGVVPYVYNTIPFYYGPQTSLTNAVSSYDIGGQRSATNAFTANGLQYGSASSSTINSGNYQVASSLAENAGRGTVISNAQTIGGVNPNSSAFSASHLASPVGYNEAVSAAQSNGLSRSTLAQSTQVDARGFQHSGASNLDLQGVQSSQAHSFRVGY